MLSDGVDDYLYGPDGTPIEEASLSSGAPQYFVSDDQGSTRVLTSSSGAVDATFSFDPYGNLTLSSGPAATPLLYDGQYLDAATGSYYLRARWYDPVTDQFATTDPDLAQTDQPYTYASDNPVNEEDPLGLLSQGKDAAPPVLMCPPNNNDDLNLFRDWVTGTGRQQCFTDNDPLTSSLMNDPNNRDLPNEIRQQLMYCNSGQENWFTVHGWHDRVDPRTLGAFLNDMKKLVAKALLTGAFTGGSVYEADSYLGSYVEEWWADVYPDYNYAYVTFYVTNTTSLDSFFHPEVWSRNHVKDINKDQPWIAKYFGTNKNSFLPQYQQFEWGMMMNGVGAVHV
jgi:RHS repeat-associated protein